MNSEPIILSGRFQVKQRITSRYYNAKRSLAAAALALGLTLSGTALSQASEYTDNDGCTAQASASAVSANNAEPGAMLAVNDPLPRQYAAVLQNYRDIMKSQDGPDDVDSPKYKNNYEKWCSLYEMWQGTKYYQTKYGYCLKDIDHNGIPELIIGLRKKDNAGRYSTRITGMYTIHNGQAQPLLYGWGRCAYYLNNDASVIYRISSGGAANNTAALFRLAGNKLQLDVCIRCVDTPDGVKYYRLREDGVSSEQLPEECRITEQSYREALASYTKDFRLLKLTPVL